MTDRGRTRWTAAVVLAAAGAGAVVRLSHLDAQIIGGDELHSVRAALSMTLRQILTTYAATDYCIPLTAVNRVLLRAGVPLTETVLRLPALIAGILAPILLPWVAARRVGRPGAAWLAVLLACAPLLVIYSRIARPYMAAVLLASLAGLAFEVWWSDGGRRWALTYVGCAALAIWLLLPSAPIVAAPFIFAAVDAALRRGTERRIALGRLGRLGLAAGLALAAWVLPAAASLLDLVRVKLVSQTVPAAVWTETLRLEAGTSSVPVAWLFWLLAVAGLILLWRDRPRFAVLTLVLVVTQAVVLRVTSPYSLGHPIIFSRYALPVLPFVLLWLAYALSWPWRTRSWPAGRPWTGWMLRLAPVVTIVVLVLAGPLADAGWRRSSFRGHTDFVRFTFPRAELPPEAISPLYERLAREPAPRRVLEGPWPSNWSARAEYAAEVVHGGETRLFVGDRMTHDPRVRLRSLVAPKPDAFLAASADVLVVHHDPAGEEGRVVRPGQVQSMRLPEGYLSSLAGIPALLAELHARFGDPVYIDASVTAWDLNAVRRRAPSGPSNTVLPSR